MFEDTLGHVSHAFLLGFSRTNFRSCLRLERLQDVSGHAGHLGLLSSGRWCDNRGLSRLCGCSRGSLLFGLLALVLFGFSFGYFHPLGLVQLDLLEGLFLLVSHLFGLKLSLGRHLFLGDNSLVGFRVLGLSCSLGSSLLGNRLRSRLGLAGLLRLGGLGSCGLLDSSRFGVSGLLDGISLGGGSLLLSSRLDISGLLVSLSDRHLGLHIGLGLSGSSFSVGLSLDVLAFGGTLGTLVIFFGRGFLCCVSSLGLGIKLGFLGLVCLFHHLFLNDGVLLVDLLGSLGLLLGTNSQLRISDLLLDRVLLSLGGLFHRADLVFLHRLLVRDLLLSCNLLLVLRNLLGLT